MPHFKVAHIREQGQDMLIFPLDGGFHHKANDVQADILDELESRAHGAGLAGGGVAVWESGGRMHFLGPSPWHPFLRSVTMQWVMMNVNREISWPG